ncbi:Agenet-like domain [Dillenia turbinata]|uniref:Agenet-like domain n=1 Tax=Dillenia turbinata TaxID=194707 RepID=A0AAN8VTF1_9MAGN
MKFKQGCLIEVLIGEDRPYNSWYPAEMMSVDDDNYIVKYELIMDQKGEHLVERVHKERVRPQPKHGKKTTWMVGDIAEDDYNVQTCSNHYSRHSQRLKGPQRVVKEERHSGNQNGQECIERALNHQVITRKRNKVEYLGQSCADMLLGGSCKKRKTSLNGGTASTTLKGRLPLLNQVDDTSFPKWES